MKTTQILKGALLALCLQLTANDDTLKMSADDGHIFLMESGDVYYSYEADLSEKVKIGTSDLEIYEVDSLVTPEEERKFLETSHPAGIFYPCESKKAVPSSRGFYHVEMENGLDRLIWLNENVSMIAAQKRDEYKVVSVFDDYCLLTDGLVYEGDSTTELSAGDVVSVVDEEFSLGDNRFYEVATMVEEREQTKHYSVSGITYPGKDEVAIAFSMLDRDCPKLWLGQYNKAVSLGKKRVLLAASKKELFYLDPATLQIKASNDPFLTRESREVKEVLSVDDEAIHFTDGTKTQIYKSIQKLIASLEILNTLENTSFTHTIVDANNGTFEVKFAEYVFSGEYAVSDQTTLVIKCDYVSEGVEPIRVMLLKLNVIDENSGKIYLEVQQDDELYKVQAEYECTDELKLHCDFDGMDDITSMDYTFHKDFMKLFNPVDMVVGQKVLENHFALDKETLEYLGVDSFTINIYGEVDE